MMNANFEAIDEGLSFRFTRLDSTKEFYMDIYYFEDIIAEITNTGFKVIKPKEFIITEGKNPGTIAVYKRKNVSVDTP